MEWSAGAQTAAATEATRDGTGMARSAAASTDELRDALAPLTEQEGAKLFHDWWAARDGIFR